MKDLQRITIDPYPIGICAGCGNSIWSNEPYFEDDAGNKIHSDGYFCNVDTVTGRKEVPCMALYFTEICLWDEAAKAVGLERKGA